MSLIIGITGGLATGKSTVAAFFAALGAKVVNADEIVHEELNRRNGKCFKLILKRFGPNILTNGCIDRRKLGEVAFKDHRKIKGLEKIIHPIVREKILDKIKYYERRSQKNIIALDVPLLFEAGLDRYVDYTVVVKAGRTQQIKRAIRKFQLKKTEVIDRLNLQMPLSSKIKLADFIIDNTGKINQTKKEVKKIWQNLESEINKIK